MCSGIKPSPVFSLPVEILIKIQDQSQIFSETGLQPRFLVCVSEITQWVPIIITPRA